MRKLRFDGYEVHRIDSCNVGIFRVVGEGDKETKGNIIRRVSDDGLKLEHIGRYYGPYDQALRALYEMLLNQGIEDPEILPVAEAIERAREEFRPVSEAIGAAAERLGAAR